MLPSDPAVIDPGWVPGGSGNSKMLPEVVTFATLFAAATKVPGAGASSCGLKRGHSAPVTAAPGVFPSAPAVIDPGWVPGGTANSKIRPEGGTLATLFPASTGFPGAAAS